MGIKEKSLRSVFSGFILRIGGEMIVGGGIIAILFVLALDYGFILPANYSEQYAKTIMERAQQMDYAKDIVEDIQDYINYYLVDDNNIVIQSNQSRSLGHTIRFASKNSFFSGRSYVLKESFTDGTLYLEYYIRSCYSGFKYGRRIFSILQRLYHEKQTKVSQNGFGKSHGFGC